MKVINIDGQRYQLPEGISTKDIQALAGFLVTLTKVESHYLWGDGDYAFYADRGAAVSVEDLQLVTKAEAKAQSDKTRAEYEAKRAAEQQAS